MSTTFLDIEHCEVHSLQVMHVLFGTKMIALLLGSMVFCIGNAKHVDLLHLLGLI